MNIDFAAIKAENVRRYGEDIGRIGRLLLEQSYRERSHFIFELLQNAEDALRRGSAGGSSEVRFVLDPHGLRFAHFGAPFSEQDVRFICGIGESSEVHAQRLTDIGRFGIGFKSVYALTDAPQIHSGSAHFAIDCYVWPREIAPIYTEHGETVFQFPFRADIPAARDEILRSLATLNPSTLLFLREIDKITYDAGSDFSGVYLRESQQLSPNLRNVTVSGNRHGLPTEQSRFLVMDRPVFHEGQPAGRVEIAFLLDDQRVSPVENAALSVFFPTIVPTRFGAILQGPFQTTPSRDNIPPDNEWNRYIVREMAVLLRDSLGALRELRLLDADTLTAFPIHRQRFPAQELLHPLYAACANALRDDERIRCADGSYQTSGRVRIGRTKEVRDLLSPEQLGDLLGRSDPVYWVSDAVSRDKTPDLRKYLTEELAIQEIDPEHITRHLSAEFLSAQSPEWHVRLYEFLNRQESTWRNTGFLNKPFILLDDESHVAPFRDNQAQAYLPSSIQTGFPTVHPTLCGSSAAIEFLRKIGLTEPDPVDDVILNLLPKYDEPGYSPPDPEYSSALSRIHAAFATDSSQKRARLIDKLRATPFVFATDQVTGETIRVQPQGLYLPSECLKDLFAGIEGIQLADLNRGGQEYDTQRELLRACGAAEHLIPVSVEATFSEEELREMRRRAGSENNTSTPSIADQTLRGLDAILKALPTLTSPKAAALSRQLWEALSNVGEQQGHTIFSGTYDWFYVSRRSCSFDAAFVRRLNTCAWVPKPDGSLGLPSEVVFDDLRPAWKEDVFLLTKIPFKPRAQVELARQVGLEPAALDLMKKHGITEAKLRELLAIASEEQRVSSEPCIGPETPANGRTSDFTSRDENEGKSENRPASTCHGQATENHSPSSPAAHGATRPGYHTYVTVSSDDPPEDPEGLNDGERLRIEKHAIALIRSREPSLHPTPRNNPGFDLYEGASLESATRFVEVKSLKGPWSCPVTLSSTQFEKAQAERDRFWLYVVEMIGSPHSPAIHRIRDPAGKGRHFCYDSGWKAISEPNEK